MKAYKEWPEPVQEQFWSLMITAFAIIVLAPFIIWTMYLATRAKVRLLIFITSLLGVAVCSYPVCQISWFKVVEIYNNPPDGAIHINQTTNATIVNITVFIEQTQIETWSWVNIVFSVISFSTFDVAFLWFA